MTAAGITSVGGGREEMDTATNGSHIWESVFQIDGISTSSVQAPGGGNNTRACCRHKKRTQVTGVRKDGNE